MQKTGILGAGIAMDGDEYHQETILESKVKIAFDCINLSTNGVHEASELL